MADSPRTLFYPGLTVMPPFPVYSSDRLDEAGWQQVAADLERRLAGLFSDAPIAYRRQNGGHYDGEQRLKPGLGKGEGGTRIHLLQSGDPEQRPV